jgi:hypothetical protein
MSHEIESDGALRRHEIASLLAVGIFRTLRDFQPPQNLPTPAQDCLASSSETLLSVTTAVNTNGEQGEPK